MKKIAILNAAINQYPKRLRNGNLNYVTFNKKKKGKKVLSSAIELTQAFNIKVTTNPTNDTISVNKFRGKIPGLASTIQTYVPFDFFLLLHPSIK